MIKAIKSYSQRMAIRFYNKTYWRGALRHQQFIDEEQTSKTIIKTLDYDGDGLRVNKWIAPVDDIWVLKVNLINKPENPFKDWMDRHKTLGYRYCHDDRDKQNQQELQKLIEIMVFGYLRQDDLIIIFGIKKMIVAYATTYLAIFREFEQRKRKRNWKNKSVEKYYKTVESKNSDWDSDWKTECKCKWIECEQQDGIYRVKK